MRRLICAFAATIAAATMTIFGTSSSANADPVQEALVSIVEHIGGGQPYQLEGATIAAVKTIPEFYARREFRPAWTNKQSIDDLLSAIRHIEEEGLDSGDYHFRAIERLKGQADASANPVLRAELDVLLTDGLARLGYHLLFGKVDPKTFDRNWNLGRWIDEPDAATAIQRVIDSPSLAARIAALKPDHFYYERLRKGLAQYRAIAARGGWATIQAGPTLKPGMRNPRVSSLRQRLAATGDLVPGAGGDLAHYDDVLTKAVTAFQKRHSLDTDGVVGSQTRAALNVPVAARINQIRVNLERARWVLRNVGDDFVVANIAGFDVRLVRNRKPVWWTRAQVGKPYYKSPIFTADMKYVVFNPTWTVPPGILRRSMLPAVKRDRAYLAAKNIQVIDRRGRAVDPAGLDWKSFSPRKFPYQLRQTPGPHNALGQVKFIFPNHHFVFLHDTPSKSLFERTARAFSHGCIRVDSPLVLSELVLDDPVKWNKKTIGAVLAAKKTRTVFLKKPLKVLLLYWTAEGDENNRMYFKRDVYRRDARVLAKLDGPFVFSPPKFVQTNR